MMKALFRKQFMELFHFLFRQGRKNKNRTASGAVLSMALYIIVLYLLGRLSYNIADITCETVLSFSEGWSYFAVMGLLAAVFGVLTSVFSIYTTVYQAKDNELLFSMPIPSSAILVVRLLTSYALCFVFEAVIMFPVYFVYWRAFSPGIGVILIDLLLILLMPLLALFICCLLGWLLALITSRMSIRLKGIVNLAISFVFVILFINLCIRATSYMNVLATDSVGVSVPMKIATFPFMQMGKASIGNISSFFILAGIILVMCFGLYGLLSVSFLHLATQRKGIRKSIYHEKKLAVSSRRQAVFVKEWRRYRSSISYFMNSSAGSILMLITFVLMILNYEKLSKGIVQISMLSETIPLAVSCIVLCIMTGFNTISASSISLEGKNLWLAQSLPLPEKYILNAKLELHILVTVIPQLLCSITMAYLLRHNAFNSVMVVILPLLFALFTSMLGLAANLWYPKLDWVSESNAVRHSTSTRISMFGSWALVLITTMLYRHLPDSLELSNYIVILSVLLLLSIIALSIWINKKGYILFKNL